MRLFLNEHDIVIECCLFTRWQPLIAKDQGQINGSCLSIIFFSVCEKKIPTLLFTRCQALQCHYLLNGLNHML